MKIMFTGATGVMGRAAVPLLVKAGHKVRAVYRSPDDGKWLRATGAEPVQVDLFNAPSVREAVSGCDAVFHFATAIPPFARITKPAAWAVNDALRSKATKILVDAAIRAECAVFVQESVSFVYEDGGSEWLTEESPVGPPTPFLQSALDAESHVRRFGESGGRAVALRFALLYGPGDTSREFLEAVRRRKLPMVGDGTRFQSNLHIDDAASAMVAALTAPSGVYNVAEDEPLTATELMSVVCGAAGARPPRRIPRWIARLVLGSFYPMTVISQRVSSERFKAATGWTPSWSSAREGWPAVLDEGLNQGLHSQGHVL